MGNRAVITTAPYSDDNMGIYVHWNGGQESIEGFMKAAKSLEYRQPEPAGDTSYGMARLTGAIALYFGGSTSVGIDLNKNLDTDNGDNGVWLIGGDWEIVGHSYSATGPFKPVTPSTKPEDVEKALAIAATILAKTIAAADVKEG